MLTLVQFDTRYEFVHSAVPIENVPPYELEPRNATALLDAVGRAINETGSRLAKMPEHDRPGLVVFVVMTDGHENSSVEFSKTRIKSMIDHQQTKYSWQFIFLGADQDSWAVSRQLGIRRGTVVDWDRSVASHRRAMADAGAATLQFRTSKRQQTRYRDQRDQ